MSLASASLPEPVTRSLDAFVASAERAFGTDLCSITLYGSAAEGRLRQTSDVNVIVVLARFTQAQVDQLREAARVAKAAVGLDAMFVLEAEVPDAVEAFAEKFADVQRRRRVLAGRDVFAEHPVSRAAAIARLRQVLLNLTLRLRHAYVERSLRDEQLAKVIADAAGPMRSASATLRELRGAAALAPREALLAAAAEVSPEASRAVGAMSDAREGRRLEPGRGAEVLLALISLAEALRAQAGSLSAERA